MPKRLEVKEGDKYGRLTIIKELEPNRSKSGKPKRKFLCQCDCGSDPVEVELGSLRSGNTLSCGCIKRERTVAANKRRIKDNSFFVNDETNTVTGYDYKGKEFYFDKEFFNEIKEYCWNIDSRGYAVTFEPDTHKEIKMHRLVTKCPKGMVVDHINHNAADNRLSNLRICTQLDNSKNHKVSKNNKTGITGVTWHKASSKWEARITIGGKRINLGTFNNLEDAKQARLEAELKYFGEFSINYNEIKT